MTATLIYGLVDPRTLLVRYVGKSTIGLRRPRAHRRPSVLKPHTHKNHWIKSLFALGLDYTIVVLEAEPPDLDEAECWWIAYGRACGWPLTNATDGGEGMSNPSPETRAKMSASRTGKGLHSVESRTRVSAQRKNEIAMRTPEQNRAYFARGPKRHSAATLAKIAESSAGRKHSVETRARISAAGAARHARMRRAA